MATSKSIVQAHADAPAPFLIPEEKVLAMVASCTAQLAAVSSIPDVMKVITATDAVAAIMKLVDASEEARLTALRLRIDAEARLGDLTAQIPKAKRGHAPVAERSRPTKQKILKGYGITPSRAVTAERLAATPREKVTDAVASLAKPTLHGVLAHLNLRSDARSSVTPEKQARDLAYLADEAICLLERCSRAKEPPHRGTVIEMRSRLTNLQGRKES